MQTFLPFEDFRQCAIVLDNKRLYKQIVECKQILTALRWIEQNLTIYPAGHKSAGKKIGHLNHPAVRMWIGYEEALRDYQEAMLNEWVDRRWNGELAFSFAPFYVVSSRSYYSFDKPHWLGDEDLHMSHRARLHQKDPVFYKFFEYDDNGQDYIWPTKINQELTQ